MARTLILLDQWPTDRGNSPDPRDVDAFLSANPLDTTAPAWASIRQVLADMMISLLLQQGDTAVCAMVTRYLLVIGLIELRGQNPGKVRTSQDIYNALRWRTIVLPAIQQVPAPITHVDKTLPDPASVLVRRPGFTDLFVVKQEWNRYEAGEISYIENILGGEEKEHKNTHVDISKQEVSTETEQTKFSERDTQSTDRAELQDQASSTTELALHVEASVDTSGQYGPTQVSAHVGGSLDYSSQQSNSHAVTLSKEIVSRAVTQVEQHVSETRKTVNIVKNIDTNRHAFKNTTSNPIVGIYRWVDQIVRVQVMRYPHRFVMEFELPEPAAWYRWLHADDTTKDLLNLPPIPFTLNGQAESLTNPRLSAAQISPNGNPDYLALGARYMTPGLQPPPARVTLSVTVSIQATQGDPGSDKQFLKYTSDSNLTVPDGWKAVGWRAAAVSWTNYQQTGKKPKPPNWTTSDDYTDGALNDGSMFLSVGASKPLMKYAYGDAGPIQTALDVQPQNAVGPITTGTVPIAIMTNSLNGVTVNVELDCDPLPATMTKWQIQTYEQIASAYASMKQAYADELASRTAQQGGMADGDPTQGRETVKEEIKKQVIAMLTANSFRGTNPVHWDPNSVNPPTVDFAASVASAPRLEFIEQAFEWENLTYMLYPYFWAGHERWADLQPIKGADSDFARFLRAGSARVVVPARRGFERHVQLYLWLGIVWSGGPVPAPGDDTYLSIADEITAMEKGPDDGEPAGDAWEVTLPTTLVWLENDHGLPVNKNAKIELAGET